MTTTTTALDRMSSSERAMLRHHLGFNHFPPVDPVFDETAAVALEAAGEEDWGRELSMPNGVTLTVEEIVDQLHLETFLPDPGEL